jgi:hypothetical protein
MVVGARARDAAVGEHELGRRHVVDREAVAAREQSDAAGGRERGSAS